MNGFDGQYVAVAPESANRPGGDTRHMGMVPEGFPGVNVGEMDLDYDTVERSQGVGEGH